jgi:hypothetical protein
MKFHKLCLLLLFIVLGLSCHQDQEYLAAPPPIATSSHLESLGNRNACWGQATAVFARMGEMGMHASQQANPRLGLRNLARQLYEQGVIAEPTMQALGAFVASELGLSVESCQ